MRCFQSPMAVDTIAHSPLQLYQVFVTLTSRWMSPASRAINAYLSIQRYLTRYTVSHKRARSAHHLAEALDIHPRHTNPPLRKPRPRSSTSVEQIYRTRA
ncbi:hypothetical protein FS842_005076 [Serendipita sp. 407]|nr:hypothetical protein FRC16_009939 [Serendipita sp. 398]KAG9057633.1 hypothetical protein FS842_005076 [Serendipita sp. 407]